MKIVYICSPFRGDTETNIANAQKYSRFAVDEGVLPIAPHLLFPQFMNDDVPEERNQAMNFNQTILHLCQEVWVFGKSTTMGMAFEIAFAEKAGIEVKYYDKDCQEVQK